MSGLGIVIEEKEPPPASALFKDKDDSRVVEHEILLPPLPETNLEKSPTKSHHSSRNSSRHSSRVEHGDFSDCISESESLEGKIDLKEIPYELDSPKLNIHAFPKPKASQNSASFPNLATLFNQPSPSSISSPLRSIKSGIRKLSLGSSGSSGAAAAAAAAAAGASASGPARPALYPLQTSLSSVTNSSVSATKHEEKIGVLKRHSHNSSHSSVSTDALSIGSMNTTAATSATAAIKISRRSRTPSNSILTPSTSPLNSPVITLSENLSSTKKKLVDIEAAYFEQLHQKHMYERDPSVSSDSSGTSSTMSERRISSIPELACSGDLINYSQFLVQQKKTLWDAFEVTKTHLMSTGWCSEHDLNNLMLQQDTQIAQIDTKLLQIEEKLNRDHGISINRAFC